MRNRNLGATNPVFSKKLSRESLEKHYLGAESVQQILQRAHRKKYSQKYEAIFGFSKESTFDRVVPKIGQDSVKNIVLFDRLMKVISDPEQDLDQISLGENEDDSIVPLLH